DELLQTHPEYDWKLKSLEKTILKLQNKTQSSTASVLGVESLVEGFRLLLVALGTAQREVVAFLKEKESVAVKHINRILEHKRTFMENKLKLEKMPAHSTKCVLKECCEFRKSSRLKDKLSQIRWLITEPDSCFAGASIIPLFPLIPEKNCRIKMMVSATEPPTVTSLSPNQRQRVISSSVGPGF
ncbi:unnamed protein product, partial [Bubo scandiacus]